MFHRSAHIWLLRPSHTLYTWLSSQSASPTLASRRTTLWTALPMPMGEGFAIASLLDAISFSNPGECACFGRQMLPATVS